MSTAADIPEQTEDNGAQATAYSFVSDFLLRRLAGGTPLVAERQLRLGAVLATDVESFTATIEGLMRHGADGLHRLTTEFNTYFCTVADAVYRHGGDIIDTAGDSFCCLWLAEDAAELAEVTASAARAALEISAAEAGSGVFPTRLGLGAGPLELVLAGGFRGRWQVIPHGPAVDAAYACESDSPPNRVLVSAEAAAQLGGRAALRPAAEERALLVEMLGAPWTAREPGLARPVVADAQLHPLLPAPVRAAAGVDPAWLSDFRRVHVVMAHLGRPELEREQAIIRAFQETLARYEGAAKVSVDGKGLTLSGVFGLPPRAHADDGNRVLLASSELADRLAELGVEPHLGVTSGRIFCGVFGNDARRDYALFGDTMNLASRLATASPDGILVDEETLRATTLSFEVSGPRALAMKNRAQPVRAHPLLGLGAPVAPERDLVDRHEERARIEADLAQLVEDRRGSTLLIEGEQGIGKSALVRHVRRQAEAAGVVVLTVTASSVERGTAYRSWQGLLTRLLADTPTVDGLHARLQGQLRSDQLLPLLNPFLPAALPPTPESSALSSDARSEQLNGLLCGLIRTAAEAAPTLLVVEDAHWLDSMSWALLRRVTEEVPSVMTLITERTGDASSEPLADRARLRAAPRTQVLALGPLSRPDTEILIHQRLGTTRVDPALQRLVLGRVSGHPFFCEALLDMLIEHGTIQITGAGAELAGEPSVDVPASAESAILGRLDRLAFVELLTLKTAAVVGMTFGSAEVAAAHPAAAGVDVAAQLESLTRDGFLAATGSSGRYRFWHQVIQEVTYGVLTDAQRRQTHRRLAEWYESGGAATAQARPELLAHHWAQAGSPQRAAPYLEQVGRDALQAGAFAEAVDLLRRAMEADPAVSTTHRALQEKALADARYFLGDLEGSRVLLELSLGRLGYPVSRGPLAALADFGASVGRQALHLARPRRFLGSRAADPLLAPAADALRVLVQISYLHGDSSLELFNLIIRGLNLAELAGPSAELSRALANAAAFAGLAGFHRRAERYAARAVALIATEDNASAAAYVWNITAIMHANRGKWETALADNARALALFIEVGDTRLESELWQTRAATYLCPVRRPISARAR
jgi:class 3 adenylate cyclase/tetratricopeptide (TPR) repeat protein